MTQQSVDSAAPAAAIPLPALRHPAIDARLNGQMPAFAGLLPKRIARTRPAAEYERTGCAFQHEGIAMKWMLIERKPGVVMAGNQENYLGVNDEAVPTTAQAARFESREAAEAHRRKLKNPYNWVTIGAD